MAEAGNKPPGKEKVAGAVQWAVNTLGEDELPLKTMVAIFGCIPDEREPSLGLGSSVPAEFEGSAIELDVLSAGDLGQDRPFRH